MIVNTFIKNMMLRRWLLRVILLATLILPNLASAQFFNYNTYGDVLLGFRKTGVYAGNYEMMVDAGSVTNFIQMPIGTSITISNYAPSQLSDAFSDGFDNLQWSAFAAFPGSVSPWSTPIGSFPKDTLWFTRPTTNVNTRSVAPPKNTYQTQQSQKQLINGAGNAANSISKYLSITNADNNTLLVREPLTYSAYVLSAFIGDKIDYTVGDFGANGSGLGFSVENTTPTGFTGSQRCDFYQVAPLGYVDPITKSTNGVGLLVGYFLLNSTGTMTFTRTADVVVTNSPPPPPANVTIVSSSGGAASLTNVFNIQFGTTNGATYTLYFTNANGLTAPVTSWPAWPTTIVGNGGTTNFSIAATNVNMFFRIGAQ